MGGKHAPPNFDPDRFAKDLRAARDVTKPSDREEAEHMGTIEKWTAILLVVGLCLGCRGVLSPVAMIILGYYKYAQFAILAHHSLHGGWGDRRRGWYANGVYRRMIDWMDWIFPLAWVVEHNKIHHYYLNEDADPDFVERNTEMVQASEAPLGVKYMVTVVMAVVWKWYYYASNTLKLLHADKPGAPSKTNLEKHISVLGLFIGAVTGDPWYQGLAMDFLLRVVGPPLLLHFMAIPVLSGLIHGTHVLGAIPFCWCTFANIVGAEVITNVHAFCTIVTNHAGADLWHFDGSCKADTAEFFLRAVLGSTAYHAGSDLVDYFHGYLNYQGEHHAFPTLSPLHYQRLHPHFKRVCADHGVPYVQEPVWVRTKKTADVIVGVAKHKRLKGNATEQPELWMCGGMR